jgi:hypothetical protein
VTALAANVAVRPTFTELGHLTAFGVGLAAAQLVPNRDDAPYPSVGQREASSELPAS